MEEGMRIETPDENASRNDNQEESSSTNNVIMSGMGEKGSSNGTDSQTLEVTPCTTIIPPTPSPSADDKSPPSQNDDNLGLMNAIIDSKPFSDGLVPSKNEEDPWSLSTIGIGNVFLHPPPNSMTSFEIIGTIKTVPEDFVVREVSKEGKVAALTDLETLPKDEDCGGSKDEIVDPTVSKKQKVGVDREPRPVDGICTEVEEGKDEDCNAENNSSTAGNINEVDGGVKTDPPPPDTTVNFAELLESSPMDVLTELVDASILKSIEALHSNAKKILVSLSKSNDEPAENDDTKKENEEKVSLPFVLIRPIEKRGYFHQALKLVFPLLKSETFKEPDTTDKTGATAPLRLVSNKGKLMPIKVDIDDCFFPLAAFLPDPVEGLISLYSFRNAGVQSMGNGGDGGYNGRSRVKKGRNNGREGNSSSSGTSSNETTLPLLPSVTKLDRRKVHHLISGACRELETSTRSIPVAKKQGSATDQPTQQTADINTSIIVIHWSKNAHRKANKRKISTAETPPKNANQQQQQQLTLCILQKRKVEHMNLLQCLQRIIRCRPSDIGLAGIKDYNAVTSQFATFRGVPPARLRGANRQLKSVGIQLGNWQHTRHFYNIGDLKGNAFEITLRNVKLVQGGDGASVPCPSSHFSYLVTRVESRGFINFYGEQRVGEPGTAETVGVRSFDVGRAMLKQDFEGAVQLLMKGRHKNRMGDFVEGEEIRAVRQEWKENHRDVKAVLRKLPKSGMNRESIILKGLKRYGRDEPLKAIRCLPYTVRTFWINAYQSYVWNCVATERIRRFGCVTALGDLYMREGGDVAVVATNEEVTKVDFGNVVLPLPGYNVQYPQNCIGDFYKELLEKDGVSFQREGREPESTAKGGYRKIMVVAKNLKWERVPVTEVEGDSDIVVDGAAHSDNLLARGEDVVHAAKLSFELESGCFATMMLRELKFTTKLR